MNDQWAWWAAALMGNAPPVRDGTPYSGYYRHRRNDRRQLELSEMKVGGARTKSQIIWEAIGIWREDDGRLICQRGFPKGTLNVRGEVALSPFRGGETMTPEQIDELWSTCSPYPISFEIFEAVMYNGAPWPQAILADKGETIAAKEAGTFRIHSGTPQATGDDLINEDAVPGHNRPPEDAPVEAAPPITEDHSLARQIEALEKRARAWLEKIGGRPTTRAEADLVANYATEFGKFQQEAIKLHKAEKAPVLEAGRTIDAKWFGLRDNAALLRGKLLDIGNAYIAAEQRRLADEARAAAKEAGAPESTAPLPRVTIGTTKTVSQRGRTVFDITDFKALALHFASMERPPAEFAEGCQKAVNRLAPVMSDIPGIERRTETKAA